MNTKGHIGSRRSGYLFLILPLLIYGVFFILPNVSSLVYSLFSWNGISEERTFVGLANFKKMFADRIFRTALINTVKYTVTLVLFQTLIGFLLALLVQKTNRINSAFRTIYFLPAIIAASTVAPERELTTIAFAPISTAMPQVAWEMASSRFLILNCEPRNIAS